MWGVFYRLAGERSYEHYPGREKKKKQSCGGVGRLIRAAALHRRRSSRAPRVTRDDLGAARRRRKSETIRDAPIFLLESFSTRPFLQDGYEQLAFQYSGGQQLFLNLRATLNHQRLLSQTQSYMIINDTYLCK